MTRTWKYLLKDLPDDATPLAIHLQREELLFRGQLSWTCPMRMAAGTEHVLQDQTGMIMHKALTAKLSWESSSWMEGAVSKKPASRVLFGFVPAGVFVLKCALIWAWTFVCTPIYKWSTFCFSVHTCCGLSGARVCRWMDAFLGCGVTYSATRFTEYRKYPFSIGQFAWLKTSVPTGEEPNLVTSKIVSVLRRLLRLELGNDENTTVLLRGLFHWLDLEPVGFPAVSGGGLGVFLQPLGLLVRPWADGVLLAPLAGQSWDLAFMSCWEGIRTLTPNFSLWILRIYMMCKKPLEVVCYPSLFILSTVKLKLLCPFGNNEWFVCENRICKKKLIWRPVLDFLQIVIWSFCHHNHF